MGKEFITEDGEYSFNEDDEVNLPEETIEEDSFPDENYEVELPEEIIEEDTLNNENDSDEDNHNTEEAKPSKIRFDAVKAGKNVLSWVWTIVLAFVIAIVINSYIIRASEVYGASMNPTLYEGDVVFISRLPYIFGNPKHNDIVVFDSTFEHRNFFTEIRESLKYNMVTQKMFGVQNTDKYWIKRVIGVPGDVISVKDGILYRNGEVINENYVNPAETPEYHDFSIMVEDGYIFVMGDNRNHSQDSRVKGPVPINDVLGKVVSGAD